MKNKTLKKVMAFSLAAFMAISAVGCGGNGDVSSTPATTDTTSESVAETTVEDTPLYNVGTLPIVNEPVTIKILTQDVTGRPFTKAADAGIWAWLEEKTGITIEVESYPAEELKQKVVIEREEDNQLTEAIKVLRKQMPIIGN